MGIPFLPRRPGRRRPGTGTRGDVVRTAPPPRWKGARAPAAGRSILPHLGRTKGEEKGSKQPSVCQSLTHPRARRLALGISKRQALLREPEPRPAGRTEGQGRGRARHSRGRGPAAQPRGGQVRTPGSAPPPAGPLHPGPPHEPTASPPSAMPAVYC